MNSETTHLSRRDKLRTFVRIMNVRLRFIFLMVVTGLVAAKWETITAHWERWTERGGVETSQVEARTEYYCPMHPSVVRGEPGNCPICGMPLSKRERGKTETLPEGVVARVQLSPYRLQLAGVSTSEVTYVPLQQEIRTVGTIEMDERRVAHIAARFGGRIERLYADFTGATVARGEALAEIYSPDLITTQQEYLTARRNADNLERMATDTQALADARALVEASRERLRLWGITDEQIAELEERSTPSLRSVIRAPIGGVVMRKNVLAGQYVMEGTELYTVADLSRVWMTAYIFEDAIASVRPGQAVELSCRTHPGRVFEGTVSFIWPTLDEATRTLRVRTDIPNPDFALRPGMYVEAIIRGGPENLALAATGGPADPQAPYFCPMHPEIVADLPGDCPICGMSLTKVDVAPTGAVMAIPESAVIDTGGRKVVYREREPGTFDAVEVELGALVGGYYPVLLGLAAGDRVVTRSAFLVDAEVRLNPAAAGSYFGASGSPTDPR